jgi:hypothetical protein
VKTGDIYYGPYLSFWLFPGPDRVAGETILEDVPAIAPLRGLTFSFAVDANFVSQSANTTGVYPSKLDIYALEGNYRLVSSEANSNFLFFKAARSPTEDGATVR